MRRLGQHFLRNRLALKEIADSLEIKPGEIILEIGPGHGELTDFLLRKKPKIIALEKDNSLVHFLKSKYRNSANIKIIEGDALKVIPALASKFKNYKLVGNIPYYITGFLFRTLAELKNKPTLIVVTVQKEVAERLTSRPPKMNLLASSLQFWAEPKIIKMISKRAFSPPPKVDSAIIKITPKRKKISDKEWDAYYNFITVLFRQPRKTILNNLRVAKSKKEVEKILARSKIKKSLRPQNLKIEEIKKLTALFKPNK